MKQRLKDILELAGCVLIIFLFQMFYVRACKLFGTSQNIKLILKFLEYLFMCVSMFIIYRKHFNYVKTRLKSKKLNNIVIAIVSFVFMIFIAILINKLSVKFLNKEIMYPFTNYFDSKITLKFIVNLSIECIFKPFIVCMIFIIGISNIIKKPIPATIISGLIYGIVYGYFLKVPFNDAILSSLIPAINIMILMYLYKTNKNIISIIAISILYVLFGSLLIKYIM